MKLHCARCGVDTNEELGFCTACGSRLIPRNAYDLDFTEFAYGPDLNAIEAVKVAGFLPYLLKRFTVGNFEKALLSQLSSKAQTLTCPSDLDALLRRCAMRLSMEALPEAFIVESTQANAFTFGANERASLVLTTSLLRLLTFRELTAVFGHELAHVKSGHIMYHTLAEVLAGGISMSASILGLDGLSIPIRLALLAWHRESEVTADRASLLLVNDFSVVESLMTKLGIGSGKENAGLLESFSELFHAHPAFPNRLQRLREFSVSDEFAKARRKIEVRQSVIRGLIPICRFCGAEKQLQAMFCPNCGKCQI